MSAVSFSRAWAMPNRDTFSVPPMGEFVRRYLAHSRASVDLFARNNRWATVTNDLDPKTKAQHHMDAEAFCRKMARQERKFDLAIFDPPYSPRQVSECYNGMGRKVTAKDTQNAALYKRARDALVPILTPNAVVLSFGWNSNGMGVGRGFSILELVLVAHGGAHNDTICMAERFDNPPGGAWTDEEIHSALAAAASGGDVKQAPGEAPQSGPKGNAQPSPGDTP